METYLPALVVIADVIRMHQMDFTWNFLLYWKCLTWKQTGREGECEYLPGDDEVGVHSHGGTIANEVSYGFHDIPGVLPPRETRQQTELKSHGPQSQPRQPSGPRRGHLRQRLSLLWEE